MSSQATTPSDSPAAVGSHHRRVSHRAGLPHLQSGYPLQEDSWSASLFPGFGLISFNARSRCVGALVGATQVVGRDRGRQCRTASLPCLSERPFQARPSGNLLEFLQLRSNDRRASVSSSFPSQPSLGGHPAPSATYAQLPTQPWMDMETSVNALTQNLMPKFSRGSSCETGLRGVVRDQK